jgi:hypothetical protein
MMVLFPERTMWRFGSSHELLDGGVPVLVLHSKVGRLINGTDQGLA